MLNKFKINTHTLTYTRRNCVECVKVNKSISARNNSQRRNNNNFMNKSMNKKEIVE